MRKRLLTTFLHAIVCALLFYGSAIKADEQVSDDTDRILQVDTDVVRGKQLSSEEMNEELREEAVNPEAQRLNFGPKHEMCSEEKQPWDGSSQTATSCELKFTINGCITLQDPAVVINADKKDITFCVESESSIKGDTLYL